ncbi:Nucleotidyltransferase domain-containing protein [Halomonas shengliensis]|uniref:Nucleotidyltransferase domain-containing protein n=1 Tax=Halomonas shengliensis TaxID=419597 RepID=A0A1H0L679_9GAMM|nr:nucleotidyltransferase domain-containing protein [Halomonas shengliensis]SDO63513.1 Nucleotidyltransferase domain-containing protein [Halomonas shengliensis]
MRLNQHEIDVIKTAAAEIFGKKAEIRLFGSRVDDAARGGDIDLMVTVTQPVENPAWDCARLEGSIIMKLGEQKIDVLLEAPGLKRFPIHETAKEKGILL